MNFIHDLVCQQFGLKSSGLAQALHGHTFAKSLRKSMAMWGGEIVTICAV